MKGKRPVEAGKRGKSESGVALVTVVMISVLLLIACIAILSAVSAHSRNVTDVLSESKAYYAAESGLQATINVLRGNTDTTPNDETDDIDYKKAVNPAYANYTGDPTAYSRLSRAGWLGYNYPVGAAVPDRVVIGRLPGEYDPLVDVAYKIRVYDPDDTQSHTIFSTSSGTVYIPSPTAADRVEISFAGVSNRRIDFPLTANPQIATFTVRRFGVNAVNGQTAFDIAYTINAVPRPATALLRATATMVGGNTVQIKFLSYKYQKLGSEIDLCATAACPAPVGAAFLINIPAVTGSDNTAGLWAVSTPVEPYRLVVNSVGFGPRGARKELEAVLHRNFFNNLTPGAPIIAPGPMGTGFTWNAGNSNNVRYCGIDQAGDINNNCQLDPGEVATVVPSVGVSDPAVLAYILANQPPTPLNPPPAMTGAETPDWATSPAALDELVRDLRITSQNSLSYYSSGVQPPSFGDHSTGTGLTFCDGNCSLSGDGGGILVVTGKLTLSGAFSFRGLIIVTGQAGVDRQGGGNGSIVGSLMIAGYDPNNLAAGFYPPRYDMNGGGISQVNYSSTLNTNFDGQTAISDFMQGVAEK